MQSSDASGVASFSTKHPFMFLSCQGSDFSGQLERPQVPLRTAAPGCAFNLLVVRIYSFRRWRWMGPHVGPFSSNESSTCSVNRLPLKVGKNKAKESLLHGRGRCPLLPLPCFRFCRKTTSFGCCTVNKVEFSCL